MNRKILIMGLPGSGKTTLAKHLALKIQAVHFNADEVRSQINKDLTFSLEDRIEHARRMGWLCDRVTQAGYWAIADFVCPTEQTRRAFGPSFVIYMDTISQSRFEDTNRMFEQPQPGDYHVKITDFASEDHANYIAEMLNKQLLPHMFQVN